MYPPHKKSEAKHNAVCNWHIPVQAKKFPSKSKAIECSTENQSVTIEIENEFAVHLHGEPPPIVKWPEKAIQMAAETGSEPNVGNGALG